jgi:hypothetical protein
MRPIPVSDATKVKPSVEFLNTKTSVTTPVSILAKIDNEISKISPDAVELELFETAYQRTAYENPGAAPKTISYLVHTKLKKQPLEVEATLAEKRKALVDARTELVSAYAAVDAAILRKGVSFSGINDDDALSRSSKISDFDASFDKQSHRERIYQMSKSSNECIVYLDDENAGATQYFLNRGVAGKRLVPVNHETNACDAIFKTTGVEAICMDIFEFVSTTRRPFAVVWFDMTCTLNKFPLEQAFLANAKQIAITLSTHTYQPDNEFQRLRMAMTYRGFKRISGGPYIGRSGKRNMIVAFGEHTDE